jgi:hypothetical protein
VGEALPFDDLGVSILGGAAAAASSAFFFFAAASAALAVATASAALAAAASSGGAAAGAATLTATSSGAKPAGAAAASGAAAAAGEADGASSAAEGVPVRGVALAFPFRGVEPFDPLFGFRLELLRSLSPSFLRADNLGVNAVAAGDAAAVLMGFAEGGILRARRRNPSPYRSACTRGAASCERGGGRLSTQYLQGGIRE